MMFLLIGNSCPLLERRYEIKTMSRLFLIDINACYLNRVLNHADNSSPEIRSKELFL